MAENTAPLEPASAPPQTGSTRWSRRLDTSPGIIDAEAAEQIYARTAGRAMQRIARASELATHHASADQGGAAGELLLARTSMGVASAQGEASLADSAAVVSVRRADRGWPWRDASSNHKTAHDAALSASSTAAPSALTARLQRRAPGPGVVKIQAPQALDHAVPGVSLRSGLHERLAARAGSAPQPIPAAVRLARGADQPVHGNEVALADPIVARAARAGETVSRLARASADAVPAALLMPLGDPAPANPSTAPEWAAGKAHATRALSAVATPNVPSAPQAAPVAVSPTTASTVARKPTNAPAHATPAPTAQARTSEIAPATSASLATETTLHLAGASATESVHAAFPTVAPDVVATPSPVSVVHPVVHRMSGSPLSLARTPDYRATYATGVSATHDAAPAHAKHRSSPTGGAIARVAEIPAAASHADPTLVWRAANETGARAWPARSRDAWSSGVLMRAGTEDATDAGSATTPSAPAAVPPAADAATAGTLTAPAPAPDMNQLAEQVTRLIVRRLEVERERRGGKRWI